MSDDKPIDAYEEPDFSTGDSDQKMYLEQDLEAMRISTARLHDDLPPAYGGCTCECHRSPGMVHMAPCCSITDDAPTPYEDAANLQDRIEEEEAPKPVGEKVSFTKELRSHSLASSMVLSGITYAADKSLIKRLAVANHDDEGLTIALTANGNELNFGEFARRLEDSIDRQVLEKAKELALDMAVGKFDDIKDLMEDLEERLKEEINSRLDDWEDPL